MEDKVLMNHKDKPVRVIGRGIASIVTYTSSKTSSAGGYSNKPRCVWPNSIFDDSKYLSRKIIGISRY